MRKIAAVGLVVLAFALVGRANAAASIVNHSGTVTKTYLADSGGLKIYSITVTNDSAAACTATIFNSNDTVAHIAADLNESVGPFTLNGRISTSLAITLWDTDMYVTVLYETGAYGHNLDYVGWTTTQDTAYSGSGDLIGVLVTNWSDTVQSCVIHDGFTKRFDLMVAAEDTRYFPFDRVHFTTSFLVTLDSLNMSATIIRR